LIFNRMYQEDTNLITELTSLHFWEVRLQSRMNNRFRRKFFIVYIKALNCSEKVIACSNNIHNFATVVKFTTVKKYLLWIFLIGKSNLRVFVRCGGGHTRTTRC